MRAKYYNNSHSADNANNQCLISNPVSQSIANDSWTVYVAYNIEVYDPNAMHDVSANPTDITIKKDGLYLLTASAAFAPNATGSRSFYIKADDTAVGYSSIGASAAGQTQLSAIGIARLTAGQVVKVQAYQNSGGTLNISSATAQVVRLGA